MLERSNFGMTAEEFREHGHRMIDWIANYHATIEERPVVPRVAPGEIRARLPRSIPENGEDFSTVFADVERWLVPGLVHWQSPNFFAYFPSNGSAPAILGELLSAGLGIQGMLWATSPAATELETHVLDQLADLLALPPKFSSTSTGGGVIQDTASTATLSALLAARERATAGAANRSGGDGRLVAYASSQAHSSIEKAVRIAGLGSDRLRAIEVDDALALRPAALAAAIAADRERGLVPCFVCATVGTTSSLAFDPLRPIGEICAREDLWLHVDAAMAGTAALCPELRSIHDGLELASSYVTNPHKWMLTTFDCTAFWVADRAALVGALGILPEYLKNSATASGEVFDYRDWQIQLGRRFRALKLWFVLRTFGAEALRALVRRHVALAGELARAIEADARFEIAAPPALNLVCFRLRASDEANRRLLESANATGDLYLTHTKLAGRYVLRFCVGQAKTEARHVRAAWQRLRTLADAVTA
ncbi:MAG: pyridoxal-dependent decarboxylase [Thermoanaerobaculia bacterium]